MRHYREAGSVSEGGCDLSFCIPHRGDGFALSAYADTRNDLLS